MTGSTDELTNPQPALRRLVFVYGTLKEGYGNHRCLYDSPKVGDATLMGNHRMYSLGGFPGVVRTSPEEGGVPITGELYETTPGVVLGSLDSLEGYRPDDEANSFYLRRQVMVETSDGLVTCETYFLNHSNTEMKEDEYPEILDGTW